MTRLILSFLQDWLHDIISSLKITNTMISFDSKFIQSILCSHLIVQQTLITETNKSPLVLCELVTELTSNQLCGCLES